MFRLDEGLKVYLHREPVDFRLNINGLAFLVEQALGLDRIDFYNHRRPHQELNMRTPAEAFSLAA